MDYDFWISHPFLQETIKFYERNNGFKSELKGVANRIGLFYEDVGKGKRRLFLTNQIDQSPDFRNKLTRDMIDRLYDMPLDDENNFNTDLNIRNPFSALLSKENYLETTNTVQKIDTCLKFGEYLSAGSQSIQSLAELQESLLVKSTTPFLFIVSPYLFHNNNLNIEGSVLAPLLNLLEFSKLKKFRLFIFTIQNEKEYFNEQKAHSERQLERIKKYFKKKINSEIELNVEIIRLHKPSIYSMCQDLGSISYKKEMLEFSKIKKLTAHDRWVFTSQFTFLATNEIGSKLSSYVLSFNGNDKDCFKRNLDTEFRSFCYLWKVAKKFALQTPAATHKNKNPQPTIWVGSRQFNETAEEYFDSLLFD